MDIWEARAISSIHGLNYISFIFLKPKNLTKGDGVKTKGIQLLQFEIVEVKSQS
jgi:hypothetical protein